MAEYPTRPSFFAHKVCRLLGRTSAAQKITPAGAYLVTQIAMLEDTKRYSEPVSYMKTQLAPIIGVSLATLKKITDKCVEEGWLYHQEPPKGSHEAGIYWVTIPPKFTDFEDGAYDHETKSFANLENEVRMKFQRSANEVSPFIPIEPNPIPDPEETCSSGDEPPSPEYTKFFSAFWENYPRKAGKRKASEEYDRAVGRIARARGLDRVAAHEWLAQVALEFSQSPKGRAGKFCPMAQTWLSQGRYDDDRQEWQDGGNDRTTADAGKRHGVRSW